MRPALLPCCVAVLALLGACATNPTPYQPLADGGGYEEARLQERVYRVSFRGNRYTPETTVLDYVFLRSAELTVAAGYTHFAIQEDFGRTGVHLRSLGPRASVGLGMGLSRRSSFWGLGFGAPLSETEYHAAVDYHLAVFVIRMLTESEARERGEQAYDAAYLLRSLEPKRRQGTKDAP